MRRASHHLGLAVLATAFSLLLATTTSLVIEGLKGNELAKHLGTEAPPGLEASAIIVPGTCYSPFHNSEYPLNGGSAWGLDSAMDNDFSIMKDYFSVVRTYYSSFYGFPVAPHAAKYGVKLYLGIFMTDESWYENQVADAIAAVKDYGSTIAAIIVGNENIAPAGPYSAAQVSSRITEVRTRLNAAGLSVPVGTVQRFTEWENAGLRSQMKALAANSDIIGVNIYPFFDASYNANDPLALLDGCWNTMTTIYSDGVDKLRLTEIGFPTAGAAPSIAPNNVPSLGNSLAFYKAFLNWSPANGGHEAFWFMFFDRRPDDNTMQVELEKYFGFWSYTKQAKTSNYPVRVGTTTAAPTTAPTTAPVASSSQVCRVHKVFY